jgi:enamine deaminase RidA (YjgF/YER057c/UK114 family)
LPGYPHAIAAGPFVFTAGITAADGAHGVPPDVQVPDELRYLGSCIKRQASRVLESLANVLSAAGSSLDEVVSAQVVLTDLEAFFAFDEVWREHFPHDPPARTVYQGRLADPGCLVLVEAIALSAESGLKKVAITTDGAPIPTTAESQAVRAGDYIFVGGLMAIDYRTGLAASCSIDPASVPYENATRKQVESILASLDAILSAAGSSRRNVVKVGAFHTDIATDLWAAMEVRRDFFPTDPPASTTIEVPSLLAPSVRFMFNAIALADEATS